MDFLAFARMERKHETLLRALETSVPGGGVGERQDVGGRSGALAEEAEGTTAPAAALPRRKPSTGANKRTIDLCLFVCSLGPCLLT